MSDWPTPSWSMRANVHNDSRPPTRGRNKPMVPSMSIFEIQLLTKTVRGPAPLTRYAADAPTEATGAYPTFGSISAKRTDVIPSGPRPRRPGVNSPNLTTSHTAARECRSATTANVTVPAFGATRDATYSGARSGALWSAIDSADRVLDTADADCEERTSGDLRERVGWAPGTWLAVSFGSWSRRRGP